MIKGGIGLPNVPKMLALEIRVDVFVGYSMAYLKEGNIGAENNDVQALRWGFCRR